MKTLTVFIFSLLFIYPVYAQRAPKNLDSMLQAQTSKARLSIERKPHVAVDPIIKDLQNEPLTHLSWQDFLTKNQHAKEVEMASNKLDNQATLLSAQEVEGSFMDMAKVGSHTPPYEQMAKGHRFIFIAESINHETPLAINEAVTIIKSIRKANPKARILLASEFLVWTGEPECSLLQKADGESCLSAGSAYIPTFEAAKQAGVDLLALDDFICTHYLDNYSSVKMGQFLVFVSPQDDVPSLNISSNPADDLVLSAEQFIAISPWGVRERTRQWARRINALRPFYDIILVHAGDGHINTTYSLDLAPMLKIKDYLLITLLPFKDLTPDAAQYYERRAQLAEQYNLQQGKASFAQTKETAEKIGDEKLGVESWKQAMDNPIKTVWIYTDLEKIKQSQQKSKKLKEINSAFPYSTENVLMVLLK